MKIVNSEDALIAVPEECNLGEVIQGNEEINIKITNNLGQVIEIWVEGNGKISLEKTDIPSGSSVNADFSINTSTLGDIEEKIVFKAETVPSGVSAEIKSTVKFRVKKENKQTNPGEGEIIETIDNSGAQPSLNLILVEE